MTSAPPRGGWTIEAHGMAAHLRDAIRLNRARRPRYVRLGGRRAGVASSLLVAAERALLPSAWLLDREARPFVETGVPILVADLMPMPAADPPRCQTDLASGREGSRQAGWSTASGLTRSQPRGGALDSVHHPWPLLSRRGTPQAPLRLGAVRRALRGGDFPEAADRLADALRAVRDTEAEAGRAYALTAHVIESAGLMAVRAPAYAEASGGETARLSRRLVVGHLPLVRAAVWLDRLAHPVQLRGVPLFVSDLPSIPFEAEHAA